MAAVAGTAIKTLEELLASPGTTGSIARSIAGALAGFTVVDIVNHFLSHPSEKAAHPGVRYGLVDLHNNTVITFVSRKRVYRLLSRSKSRRTSTKVVFVPEGDSSSRVLTAR
jgi:hypothetical protein